MEHLLANIVGNVRYVKSGGRQYIVAPLTTIVPGVLNGSKGALYYPPKEIAKTASSWDGIPLVVYHPTKNGKNVSANASDTPKIGFLKKSQFRHKLVHEGWFDVEKTRNADPRVYQALVSGSPMELSTGLYTDNVEAAGSFNGRPYDYVATNYKPDHLAILPDQVGACSVNDGCGVNVNLAINAWSDEAREASKASCQHIGTLGSKEKADAFTKANPGTSSEVKKNAYGQELGHNIYSHSEHNSSEHVGHLKALFAFKKGVATNASDGRDLTKLEEIDECDMVEADEPDDHTKDAIEEGDEDMRTLGATRNSLWQRLGQLLGVNANPNQPKGGGDTPGGGGDPTQAVKDAVRAQMEDKSGQGFDKPEQDEEDKKPKKKAGFEKEETKNALGPGNHGYEARKAYAESCSSEAKDSDGHKKAAEAHRAAAREAAMPSATGAEPDYSASGYHANKAQEHDSMVTNAWSDEARAASADARRKNSANAVKSSQRLGMKDREGNPVKAPVNGSPKEMADFHREMSSEHQRRASGGSTAAERVNHAEAAQQHANSAASYASYATNAEEDDCFEECDDDEDCLDECLSTNAWSDEARAAAAEARTASKKAHNKDEADRPAAKAAKIASAKAHNAGSDFSGHNALEIAGAHEAAAKAHTMAARSANDKASDAHLAAAKAHADAAETFHQEHAHGKLDAYDRKLGVNMNRQQQVGFLVANCDCWKKKGDEGILNQLSDEKLAELVSDAQKHKKHEVIANAATKGFKRGGTLFRYDEERGRFVFNAKAEGSNADTIGGGGTDQAGGEEDDESDEGKGLKGKKMPSTNAWLQSAPPDVRRAVQNAMAIEQKERFGLVQRLTANVSGPRLERLTRKYTLMDIDELRDIAASIPGPEPVYVGASGGPTVNDTGDGFDPNDLLPLPTMDYAEQGASA